MISSETPSITLSAEDRSLGARLAGRARARPVVYPAVIGAAYVLNLVVESGVSPYAAARPFVVVIAGGLILPWLIGLAIGDRDIAGLATGILLLVALAAPSAPIYALAAAALVLLALQRRPATRHASGVPSPAARLHPRITRALTAVAVVVLVAVGVKAIQLGRAESLAYDLVAESPFRVGPAAAAADGNDLPSMYVILLDGYPRSDKLRSEFGVDNRWFTQGLADRGFVVAERSRSNHTATRLTLNQMFNYVSGIGALAPGAGRNDVWRRAINEGRFFDDIRSLGYQVVATSPGWEHITLRHADRFVDTGQPNEFEWTLLSVTGVGALIDAIRPELSADLHRARIIASLDSVADLATEPSSVHRFVFAHIPAPHSPLVFRRDGSGLPVTGMRLEQAEDVEHSVLGPAEYGRRVAGQVGYVSDRVLQVVDTISAADPGAVIVVFSDHGSGVRYNPRQPDAVDADLRTANLLAVRSPGVAGIIDDRSTLANVLPRLLRGYAGIGPDDLPETIYVNADRPDSAEVYARPD